MLVSDMLTTLLNLSVEKKKKEPAPEPEDVVKAVSRIKISMNPFVLSFSQQLS